MRGDLPHPQPRAPRGEPRVKSESRGLLWRPGLQEQKVSQNGQGNVRYRFIEKQDAVARSRASSSSTPRGVASGTRSKTRTTRPQPFSRAGSPTKTARHAELDHAARLCPKGGWLEDAWSVGGVLPTTTTGRPQSISISSAVPPTPAGGQLTPKALAASILTIWVGSLLLTTTAKATGRRHCSVDDRS